jgi:hypothetical protein
MGFRCYSLFASCVVLFFFKLPLVRTVLLLSSVADPGCLSRIPDPGYKNGNKREGRKKTVSYLFFVATNVTKFKIILFLNWRKKNSGQFSKNYRTFYQKNWY